MQRNAGAKQLEERVGVKHPTMSAAEMIVEVQHGTNV